ncbi:GreA/GreB family elongation factor [Saccharicrinis aurantiacus]|uniref:GreA/GreB family elongation factor n=1 Tax=Saccharicrinis aurantiacus TaxID=1849719 RepID=UPI00094F57CD|nr:GreA/GreB family elongation factor [Saccharicrinis aurantiacus]
MQNIKAELKTIIGKILNDKILSLSTEIISLKESRDSDSKSSVGDKYETSRAMAHIEIDKHERQLNTTKQLGNEMNKINPLKISETVEFGSVVYTSNGNYFIGVAQGKIDLDGESFYAISLASPIGKAMFGKKIGDEIAFNNQNIIIIKIR